MVSLMVKSAPRPDVKLLLLEALRVRLTPTQIKIILGVVLNSPVFYDEITNDEWGHCWGAQCGSAKKVLSRLHKLEYKVLVSVVLTAYKLASLDPMSRISENIRKNLKEIISNSGWAREIAEFSRKEAYEVY